MSRIRFSEQSTPSTPPSGKQTFFVDSADGNFKKVDDGGVITDLEASSTAIQPGDNVSELANDAGYLTTETVTSLTLGANTLSYTDENGTVTNLDLSVYLDDTNLARLISGSLDGSGIATFTRDDSSTFTLDLSNLLDNQSSDDVPNDSTVTGTTVSDALETLDSDKLSFTAPQDDVLTELPTANVGNAGKRYSLRVNSAGNGYEYWEEFTDFASRSDPLVHQSNTTFEPYLVFTVNIPVTGNYVFRTSYRWSINTTTSNFLAHVEYNGDFLLPLHLEPQDSGGTGTNENNSTGGTTNTGTDQFAPDGGQVVFENLTAGEHVFTLEFRGQTANQEATIYSAHMTMERID